MSKTERQHWEAAGAAAFASGINFPMGDAKVIEAITGLPVGGGAFGIMKAWNSGWTRANLAAPVE